MYEQIAQNKRRAVLYAVAFFVIWVGIGALVGLVAVAATGSSNAQGSTNYAGAVIFGMAGLIASITWRTAFFMRPRGRDSQQIVLVVFAAGILFGIVAVLFGPLIRLALSRRREELADVSSVKLTRNPEGLISALKKLAQNDKPFKKFNHATAAMCIDDPLQHHEAWYHRLFDTHPPIAERIAILERIAHTQTA